MFINAKMDYRKDHPPLPNANGIPYSEMPFENMV
jgi:hypothetical protein